jgi:hypothetical protein
LVSSTYTGLCCSVSSPFYAPTSQSDTLSPPPVTPCLHLPSILAFPALNPQLPPSFRPLNSHRHLNKNQSPAATAVTGVRFCLYLPATTDENLNMRLHTHLGLSNIYHYCSIFLQVDPRPRCTRRPHSVHVAKNSAEATTLFPSGGSMPGR